MLVKFRQSLELEPQDSVLVFLGCRGTMSFHTTKLPIVFFRRNATFGGLVKILERFKSF